MKPTVKQLIEQIDKLKREGLSDVEISKRLNLKSAAEVRRLNAATNQKTN